MDEDDQPRLPDGSLWLADSLEPPEIDLIHSGITPRSSAHKDEDEPAESEVTSSLYGAPLSAQEAALLVPEADEGLIWHSHLVSDDWDNNKDCIDGVIKPRRGTLIVRASQFFSSLVQTEDGRWVFSGRLNGWPGLTHLELRSITTKVKRALRPAKIVRVWDASAGQAGGVPQFPTGAKSIRATLKMAPYTAKGWSATSPGYVWWYFGQHPSGPMMKYGDEMVQTVQAQGAAPKAVRVHHFAHRYAKPLGKKESKKDLLTYHSAVLVEWDHGQCCTVIELGLLGGVSGYRGKSNWCTDKNDNRPAMYRALPACMVYPWIDDQAEIRATDVPARSLAEFMSFLKEYEGPGKRFLDPSCQHSGDVRLYYNSQVDVMRYLLNHMGRDRRYNEEFRNCQAFAADFYGFMAGKKGVEPVTALLRATYVQRTHLFLYDPDMYDSTY